MHRFTRFLVLLIVLLLALSPVMAQDTLFQTNTPEGESVTPVADVTVEATAPVVVDPPDALIPVSVVDEILASASEQSRQVLYVMGFILALFILANGFPALRYIYNSVPAPFKDVVKSAGVGVVTALEGAVIERQKAAELTPYEFDDELTEAIRKWIDREKARIVGLGTTTTYTGSAARDNPVVVAE